MNDILRTCTSCSLCGTPNGDWTAVIPTDLILIADNAFRYCGMKAVVIPTSVVSIGDDSFSDSQLSSVIIPTSITYIGEWAFALCKKLLVVSLPTSLKAISSSTFFPAYTINAIQIPTSITAIGSNAFTGITWEILIIPTSVRHIGNYAFGNANSSSVEISTGVTFIDTAAFAYCYNLRAASLPTSLTAISSNLFKSSSLQSIQIPTFLFKKVDIVVSLSKHLILPVTAISLLVQFLNLQNAELELYYRSSSVFAYANNLLNVSLPTSLTTITSYLLRSSSLQSIQIPMSVTAIEALAFSESSLTAVVIPTTVVSVGNSAYYSCALLKAVTIPSSVTRIGKYSFASCPSLKKVVILSSDIDIEYPAFSGNYALAQVSADPSVCADVIYSCADTCRIKYCATGPPSAMPSIVSLSLPGSPNDSLSVGFIAAIVVAAVSGGTLIVIALCLLLRKCYSKDATVDVIDERIFSLPELHRDDDNESPPQIANDRFEESQAQEEKPLGDSMEPTPPYPVTAVAVAQGVIHYT
eukprot:gene24566-31991_t